MNILCYGDSNTYGYNPTDGMRYPEDIRWPSVLRSLLPDDDRLIEEGCNGRTAAFIPADEVWKDGRAYLPACLNSHKPLDLVILMLGSNDMKTQFHASAEEIAGGIRELLETISEFTFLKQGFRPWVLLLSPPLIGEGIATSPFADRFDAGAVNLSMQLAERYAALADEFTKAGRLHCDFLDAAGLIDPSEIDSLHLDPEAHIALAKAIADYVAAIRA